MRGPQDKRIYADAVLIGFFASFLSLLLTGCILWPVALSSGPDPSLLPRKMGAPYIVVREVADHRASPDRKFEGDITGRVRREVAKALSESGFNVLTSEGTESPEQANAVNLLLDLERLNVEIFGSVDPSWSRSPLAGSMFGPIDRYMSGSAMLHAVLKDSSGETFWNRLVYYHTNSDQLVGVVEKGTVEHFAGSVLRRCAVKLASDPTFQEVVRKRR